METLLVDGNEIYENLETSDYCFSDMNLIHERNNSSVYETASTIVKTQKPKSYDCINDNGDYACKSTIILESLVLTVLNKLNSKHIPRIISTTSCGKNVYLEIEKVNGKTLTEVHHLLTDSQKEAIIFQILYTLYEFQVYEFQHGDLIGSNIMIEFVPETITEYNISDEVYLMSNYGINVKLIDFEFSRVTVFGIYIFNENVRKQYYVDEYDVKYNPLIDIGRLLGNPNLMTQNIKDRNNILFNRDYKFNVIAPYPVIDIYGVISLLFDLPKKNVIISKKTINEDKSTQMKLNSREEGFIPYSVANYPNEKLDDPNLEQILDSLTSKKYNRLVYRFLTFFPDVKILYHKIEPGPDSYSNNRRIINLLRTLSKVKTDNRITISKVNIENQTFENEVYQSEVFDPILLEYVDRNNLLSDKDNIIFHLDGKQYASKKSYFDLIPESNIIVEVFSTNGLTDYIRTSRSTKYINLFKYGINAIIEYELFIEAIKDDKQEYFIALMAKDIIGANYELIIHNPKSYFLSDDSIVGFENKQYNSLKNYTSKWDRAINIYLRSKLSDEEYVKNKEFLKYYLEFGDYPEDALENIKETIKNIDLAFYEGFINTEEMVLFRGTSDCNLYDGVNIGFMSTSKSYRVAKSFAGDTGCVYEIHVGNGVPYIYMESLTNVDGEEEILLPRGLMTILRKRVGNTFVIDVIKENDRQFNIEEKFNNYSISSIDGYYIQHKEKCSMCYKNIMKDGDYIDEVKGDIIDMDNSINNNGMCYNTSTLSEILEECLTDHEFVPFVDPFTRIAFSNEIIIEVIEDYKVTVDDNTTYLFKYFLVFGNLEIMKYLVDIGTNIDFKEPELLNDAAERGYLDIVKYLFDNGAVVDSLYDRSLRLAATNNHLDVVKYLVEKGTNVNHHNCIALSNAITLDNVDVVKYLVKNGADLDLYGPGFLNSASSSGHLDIVKVLVENGVNKKSYNKAFLSACKKGHLNVVRYLVENGADIHVDNDFGLNYAANNGHLDLVKYLIDKGITMNNDALVNASASGNLEIFKYLVKHGGDIHGKNDQCLIVAATTIRLDILKYLIGKGVDDNSKSRAMIGATKNGRIESVKYLVENGADIHFHDDEALFLSVYYNNLDITEYLVENGANIKGKINLLIPIAAKNGYIDMIGYLMDIEPVKQNIKDQALVIASLNSNVDIVKCLVENGANVNTHDGEALLNAIKLRKFTMVKYLVENGIDVNTQDGKALQISIEDNDQSVVKYLVENGADLKNVNSLIDLKKTAPIIVEYLRSKGVTPVE